MRDAGKKWMWLSVGLTLLVGASLGLMADRLLLRPPVAMATARPDGGPMWFVCGEGSRDVEQEPHYVYPERLRKFLIEGLSRDLSLSDTQRVELETMLEDRRQGARDFWEDLRRSYCGVRDRFLADIRDLLEPEQAALFDEMIERDNERVREAGQGWITSAESP